MTFRVFRRCFRVRQLAVAALLILIAAGCATTSPPVQEMSDARQAIHAARAVGEGLAHPEALEEAEALLERASRALSEGHYGEARAAALAARRSAVRAREQTPPGSLGGF